MRPFVHWICLHLCPGDEEGQGLLEYALIIAFVALIVFASVSVLGAKVTNMYNAAANSINY